jgi:hypothetical protein
MTPMERFKALTARQRDEILDKHRNWNVDHTEWYDCVYHDFKRDMGAIGIEVDDIYFSGFSSQGDGACFEGRVQDWPKFLTSVGYTCPALIALAEQVWTLSVKHNGRYYHENCTLFTYDADNPNNYTEFEWDEFVYRNSPYSTDIQNATFWAVLRKYDFAKLEEEFMAEFKSHMRTLYNDLRSEFEHLTSDEAVIEGLIANDLLDETINELEETYA